MIITVEITYTKDIPDPEQRYLAQILEGDYKGTIITAESISSCFKELGISMFVLDDFKSKQKPQP